MLNPFLFFIKNKKRTCILLFIILISVFCISSVTTLIKSVYYTSKEANVSPFEKFSIATSVFENSDESELKSIENIDSIYNVIVTNTPINTVFGTTSSYIVITLQAKELNNIIKKCNLTLTDGRLPKDNSNELIIHEDILQNKNLHVGDKLSDFDIVGSFSGKTKMSFGMISNTSEMSFQQSQTSYVIFAKDGYQTVVNQALLNLSNKEWKVFTSVDAIKQLDEDFSTIDLILLIVVIMVSVCLSTAVAALVYTIYSNRYDEFAILNAIGYKKGKIILLLIEEISFISIISWALGYMFSLLALLIVDKAIYSNMGQSMPIFTVDGIVYTMIVPILVIICAVYPSIRKLEKTDLISVIERR